MQKLIVIVGPTASGKTSLAVSLARKFNGEIVSADSRQVYKGMDLGSGKDLPEYGKIPYHLIDVVKPNTEFNVAKFQRLAYKAIDDILSRGKVPILAGGTGLYVQAVVDGYILPPGKPDKELRKKLEKQSFKRLLARLKKLDPATYRTMQKNNKRRVIRAIEICIITGIPFSQQRKKQTPPYKMLMLGLTMSNPVLYQRIEKRLKDRLKQGMAKEVKKLHKQGVSWKRLESFGLEYRYLSYYLRNKMTRDRMIEELVRATKQFARRQMGWFRKDKRVKWVKNKTQAIRLVQKFL